MKNATLQTDDYPQRPMAIAVSSLKLDLYFVCLVPIGGHPKGAVLPIYGGNTVVPSAYIPGLTPNDWRYAATDGDYSQEVIFGEQLPGLMQEVFFDYHPGEFEIILSTDYRVIELPEVESPGEQECKVIQHPSLMEALEIRKAKHFDKAMKKLKKKAKANSDPTQFYLTFDTDVQQINQSA